MHRHPLPYSAMILTKEHSRVIPPFQGGLFTDGLIAGRQFMVATLGKLVVLPGAWPCGTSGPAGMELCEDGVRRGESQRWGVSIRSVPVEACAA